MSIQGKVIGLVTALSSGGNVHMGSKLMTDLNMAWEDLDALRQDLESTFEITINPTAPKKWKSVKNVVKFITKAEHHGYIGA